MNPSLSPHTPKVISVSVRVGASRTRITGELGDGTLKVDVASPPEKGKANQELLRYLADHFGLPLKGITILSGYSSRRKLIRLLPGENSDSSKR